MVVRLSLLDHKEVIFSSDIVPVFVEDNNYREIGTCKIFRNKEGHYMGDLELEEDINENCFFYYRSRTNDGGIFIFSGLDLTTTELVNKPTTRLKDMVVNDF